MIKTYRGLPTCAVILLALLVWPFAEAFAEYKKFSVFLDKPDQEYVVEVEGSMDPENLEIAIENIGDSPLINPRMAVNGLCDWYDVKSIVSEVTAHCKTDEEKAIALWEWVLFKRFQRPLDDQSALHPVRAMNGYGYGICGHNSAWLKCLWRAAGLEGRIHELLKHTVPEVFYNGAWHLFDGNSKVFYLDRDNLTIASLATLERDRWLIERTIHARDPWFRGPDPPERNDEFANFIVSFKDNYESLGYDGEIAKDYTMAMTLKPGEKVVRWWKPELGKFEGRDKRAEVPERYANGQLTWEPDLKAIDIRPFLSVSQQGNIATQREDGRSPAIHIADLQDSLYTRPSMFTIPITSAYPVVGGRFSLRLVKEGSSDHDLAAISFRTAQWESSDLYTFGSGKGSKTVELELDSHLMQKGVAYNYGIGLALRGNAEAVPQTQSGIDAFRSVTDLQVSPHSLPALTLGKNTVRFWHQSPEAVKVRVTHRWREINGAGPPNIVETAVSPQHGGEVGSLTPILKWTPARHPNDSCTIVDYQVLVSLRPDCRWPLSPTLQQNIGSAKTQWPVPPSFLNKGSSYYWKVRARDSNGTIGKWSRVFHFRTSDFAK